ncbi:MAG: OmpH family outer membrane protein [Planctomycetes bacterium]|nr:OmpH family outer membrane protein [Planctomycetota bacterium]
MQRSWFLVVLLVLGSVSVGCNSAAHDESENSLQSSAVGNRHSVSGVAVIDVDQVARRIGRYDFITTSVANKEKSLNRQLAAIQESYKRKVDDKQREIGTQPTQEQTEELAALNRELGSKLRAAQADAQKDLTSYRAELINGFRREIRPIAQRVAEQRGMNVVVSYNENVVFSYNSSADITKEVAQQLMAAAARTATAPTDGTKSLR